MRGETYSFPCYTPAMLKPTERTRTAARRSRHEPTMAEAAMWKLLRDRRLGDLKFRRQMPIAPYIADFCCPALKLIIELDGGVHVLRAESDTKRRRGALAGRVCTSPSSRTRTQLERWEQPARGRRRCAGLRATQCVFAD